MKRIYCVEQAIYSPRDTSYSFRVMQYFETEKEANSFARKNMPTRVSKIEYLKTFGLDAL